MENEDGDKFTWVMSLPFSQMGSKDFVFGGCKWFLKWRRHAKYRLTIVNQVLDKLSYVKGGNCETYICKTSRHGIRNPNKEPRYENIVHKCHVLLSLIKLLFKSSWGASTDDLSDAEAALTYMKNVGFKLDWLDKKLDQVKENKKKCWRLCEMEHQLHDMKQKCKDLETQLNKEKTEILEATTPDVYFI
ncbi:hypothetical protein AALP_AA2G137500 [Arabis alpina]|uniref:MATH domain-containing protein n=1 Tax=Arabis alpina TaxID=50452 RepID=A0A087HH92_ARAAL|nr:hypothetical protein AALP_AA2G137500 [Arabis alpina]